MAWIESHQELERHPKTLKLKSSLRVSLEHTLGVLHRLWYWSLSYAESGNLEKYGLQGISEVVGFDAQKLVDSGWIDEKPYLRIHDWWEYIGRFLKSKYKNYPKKWKSVEREYLGRTLGSPKGMIKTQLPNLTKPNLTKPTDIAGSSPASVSKSEAYKPETPLQKVVCAYKLTIGFKLDDRKWDKLKFSRCSKPAKKLLDYFDGDWEKAVRCVVEVGRKMQSNGLSFTLETIVQHADSWKLENMDEVSTNGISNNKIIANSTN